MKKIVFNISCLFLCSFFAFQQDDKAYIIYEICDTVKITAEGKGNHVKIDSICFEGTFNTTLEGKMAKGEIEQKGENNKVEIKSKRTERHKQAVEIKQTGTNNKVKINLK
jgi:hypothetical protein